jgi:Family of unknown function (DUF6459)
MESVAITSRNSKALWHHPILPIFLDNESSSFAPPPKKLYLVPTPDNYFGEELDSEYLPKPSPLSELPETLSWVKRYAIGVIEIWGGKRPAIQLARWSHRKVFRELTSPAELQSKARIRKIYLNQPIEGVIEATVTLAIADRVRSLSLRFEGVDKRWLCTELALL